MGIKFLCPNGHRLHVKSFLAGRKALCPKCGARVVVPADSEAAADSAAESTTASVEIAYAPPDSLAADASGASSTVSAAGSDPISEAADALWYVRPTTGGQFGPASGDILRGWLKEGRVGAGSLVWHAGWSNWRAAAEVFPHLQPFVTAPAIEINGQLPTAAPSLPEGVPVQMVETPAAPPVTLHQRRRRQNEINLIASAIMGVVIIILIIVLVVVYRNKAAQERETVKEARGPSELLQTQATRFVLAEGFAANYQTRAASPAVLA